MKKLKSIICSFILVYTVLSAYGEDLKLDKVDANVASVSDWSPGNPPMQMPVASVNGATYNISVTLTTTNFQGFYVLTARLLAVDGSSWDVTLGTLFPAGNEISHFTFNSVSFSRISPVDMTMQLMLHESGRLVYSASGNEIFRMVVVDPNKISNNKICTNNNFASCTTSVTVVGSIGPRTIYGALPTKGGTGGNSPVGGYAYQWEIKNNYDAWQIIPGATSQDYSFPGAVSGVNFLALRRKVTTLNYPSGLYSNEVQLAIKLCDKPPTGSATICADQYYYNVTPGSSIAAQKIIGSWKNVELYGHGLSDGWMSVVYETSSNPNGPWTEKTRLQYHRGQYKNDSNVVWDYAPGVVSKSWWPETDVTYVRRIIESRICTLIFFCNSDDEEISNTVKIVVSQCADPRINNNASITGPSTVTCPQTSVIYTASADVNCGILKYDWTLPQGWSFDTPSSGPNANSVTVKPFIWWQYAGYGVPSGTIEVVITYIDGHTIRKQLQVNGQSQPTLTTNTTNSIVAICDGAPFNLTVTASGGAPAYNFAWLPSNVNYAGITNSGNTSTMVISPQQWGGERSVSIEVTDANGCKNKIYSIGVVDGNGWSTQTPYISGAQHMPVYNGDESQYILNGTITSDLKGNVYYVGESGNLSGVLSTYQWDAAYNTWRNFPFPKNTSVPTASNSLLISETVWGNRTIYFIDIQNKISYISSINGYIDEYNVTGNWTSPTAYQNTNGVEKLLCVIPNDRIFYIDNNNNLQYLLLTGTSSPVSVDNSVTGWYGVVAGGKLYYVKNGKLLCYNISTATQITLTDNDALNTTYLDKYNNEVFFVSNNYYIRKVNTSANIVSNTMSPWWPATPCNGYFSINQSSGVIYFNSRPELDPAGMGSINQLYLLSGSYTNKRLTRYDQQGFVHYHYPNAFSWMPSGTISQTYFYITNCNPGVQRTNTSGEAETVDQQLGYTNNNFEYVAYPNPVQDLFNIDYKVTLEIKLKIVITSTLGDEKVVLFDGTAEPGEYNIQRNLNLASGLYYCTFYVNGLNTGTEKVIVQ